MDDQTKILDFLRENNISVESAIEKLNNVNSNNTVYSKAADEIINNPDFNIDMVEKIMIDLDWPAHIITKKEITDRIAMLVNDAINDTRNQIESNEVVYYTIETGGFLCIANMESDSTLLEVEVKFISLASYTTISKEKLL